MAVEKAGGEGDAEPAGEVVVAGAGVAQGGGLRVLAERADRTAAGGDIRGANERHRWGHSAVINEVGAGPRSLRGSASRRGLRFDRRLRPM